MELSRSIIAVGKELFVSFHLVYTRIFSCSRFAFLPHPSSATGTALPWQHLKMLPLGFVLLYYFHVVRYYHFPLHNNT